MPLPQSTASILDQQNQEITLNFEGTWNDFEDLCLNQKRGRISFLHNVITIMSPSFNHEAIAQILGDLRELILEPF